MSSDDLSGGDFERRKQCCGAMPLVIVALAGQGAALGQLQITLRSVQSLDRGLLVTAQTHDPTGRGNIEANNIGGFGRKVRVVALTPGLASREVNLVAGQGNARHIGPQTPPAPRPAGARSSVRTLPAAVYPAASESACRWPSYRSAACQAAACLAALQGHGRHSDAGKGCQTAA